MRLHYDSQRLVVLREADGRSEEYTLKHTGVLTIRQATWDREGFGCKDYIWDGSTNVQGLPVFQHRRSPPSTAAP